MTELASSLTSSTILVIDDDELLNRLFCEFLQDKGFNTYSAYGMNEAKSILLSLDTVDLILLDYQLRDGTGIELLKSLNDCPRDNKTPIIMISGNEDPVFLESCFYFGAADYIIKPVNLSLLALKVSALIKSVSMQKLITAQNAELERFKRDAEREESIAKFTYEYLVRQNSQVIEGVSIWLKPSSSFSGDIALAKTSPGGDLYFFLGDATGHGLSAAITVMPVVSIFNSMVSKGFHIQAIVMEINERLIRDTPQDRFVAAVVIQIHRERNEIEVWNGGMPTVYWTHEGNIIHEFKSQHMALGILDDDLFDANVETCELKEVGNILAFSDGLIEEVNQSGVSFSIAKVKEVIASNPENLQATLIEALLCHANKKSYHDDVSICVLQPGVIAENSKKQLQENLHFENSQDEIGDFSWSVKISGNSIGACEIPPLCNKFMQYMEMNQFFCQVVFLVVSEMVSNAIDHGVLKLSSATKEEANGFAQYFNERERRLKELGNSDFVELCLQWKQEGGKPQLLVSVKDSGEGYIYEELIGSENSGLSGRGLKLIRNLSKTVEIVAPGNLIRAVISPL